MKALKYILFTLGGIIALSCIGSLFMGRATPILWIIMIVLFAGGAMIKTEKKT